jgi:pre-mRNA-splicing factor SPF27|tara:strand:- start:25 stop:816 length:792 start_codon:yes stop_codon:yes gene_type:complete
MSSSTSSIVVLRSTSEALAEERANQEAEAAAAAARARPLAPSVPASDLLDAMPYTEAEELSPNVRAMARGLIEAEMRAFPSPDYFANFPAPTLSFAAAASSSSEGSDSGSGGFLASELVRVAASKPLPPLDVAERYRVAPPPRQLQGDANAWRQATRVAERVLGHQRVRILNLELAQAHGADAWRWYISNLEAEVARRTEEVGAARDGVDDVNKKRKVEQMAAGPKLHALRSEWWVLADKTAQIETGCALLEHASKRIRGDVE